MTAKPDGVYRFREFELDVAAYELRRHGRVVRLERRPMDLLIFLAERRGQLVSRADIIERLWGRDVFVDVETGVHTAIRKIRQALHDSPDKPVFIETVSGKGYRFVAPVESVIGSRGEPDARAGRTIGQPPAVLPIDSESVTPPHRSRRTLLTAGLLTIGVLGGALAFWGRTGVPNPAMKLAVLPFSNLSTEPERAYLADGLVEETIASLGQIDPEHLSVVGRTSVLQYKDTRKSLEQIGQELRVDYLVEGSVRAEGDRVRVVAKLIRARDQAQVWADSYERDVTSMLGLQRDLSTAIARQISLRLAPERLAVLARRHTGDAEAYHLYLRGRSLWHQLTPATNLRAIEYFQQATARDPRYALAWSGIANAYVASPINADVAPRSAGVLARDAAVRAIEVDPELPETQVSRGLVEYYVEWDWPAAEAYFRRALLLDPGFSMAYRYLGHLLSQTHRHGEAGIAISRATALDPYDPMNHALSSQIAFQARDYPLASEHARRALAIDPEFWIGYMQQAQVDEQVGHSEEALHALARSARFSHGNSKTHSLRGYILAKTGRIAEAREILRMLEASSRDRYVPPYAMALVHAGLGEGDAVFGRLMEAYQARDVHLVFLSVDPKWDPYREDPRFKALLAQCGFPAASQRALK